MEELENYRRQFRGNLGAAQEMLAGVTDEQFCWRPAADVWSIADNLLHLIVTGRLYLPLIDAAIREAGSKGWHASGPFRYGAIDRLLVWIAAPPVRVKLRAPKKFLPSPVESKADLLGGLTWLEESWRRRLEDAGGLDLKRTRVPSPASSKVKIALGTAFALNAAHERRHLWQAGNVMKHVAYPSARG